MVVALPKEAVRIAFWVVLDAGVGNVLVSPQVGFVAALPRMEAFCVMSRPVGFPLTRCRVVA